MRCGRQKKQSEDNVSQNSFKNHPSFQEVILGVLGYGHFSNRRPSEKKVGARGRRSNSVPGEEGGTHKALSVRV
jgi:hypothetical protein